MWRVRLYVFIYRHSKPRNLLPKFYPLRVIMPLLFNFDRYYSDRRYLTKTIFPALVLAKPHRVLFVGCREYTARYGKRLTRAGIEYWTTDVDPAAALWGQKGHHIVCDITNIDNACSVASFDMVLLNGVFGNGVDEESAMNQAVKAIACILKPKGMLLIGWESEKRHPDPLELEAVAMYFRREPVLALPLRKTFLDNDHVYDWLVKTDAAEAL
jgi:SAM-dependent methyltransferase